MDIGRLKEQSGPCLGDFSRGKFSAYPEGGCEQAVKEAPQALEEPLYCLNIFHPLETLLLCLHFLQQSKLSIVVEAS